MKFALTKSDENFDALKLESEQWELGLYSVMFGRRVRLGRKGAMVCVLDYCAGADPKFQMELLCAVADILRPLPENVSSFYLSELFPGFAVKPINLDPKCWPKLQALAEEARKASEQQPQQD